MKLKIWVGKEGKRHTSLDGKEISSILRSLVLTNHAGKPPLVVLEILPSCIEVIVDAEIEVDMGDKKYRLKE